jgi:hypothetical protein
MSLAASHSEIRRACPWRPDISGAVGRLARSLVANPVCDAVAAAGRKE